MSLVVNGLGQGSVSISLPNHHSFLGMEYFTQFFAFGGALRTSNGVRSVVVDDRAGVAEVLSGLSEGDRVIVGNLGTLGRGMQVIVAGEERRDEEYGPEDSSDQNVAPDERIPVAAGHEPRP